MRIYTVKATCDLARVVCDLVKGDPLKKRIIFCEDKFTLALELAVAKSCGGTFGTQIFSFNRFMHKYLPKNEKILSTEGCALAVKRLLLENRDKLSCFKNVYDPNLQSVVYELIAQLKSAKVTPCDIARAAENTSGNLKRKLKDIHLIFSEYEKFVCDSGFTDGNNRLNRLPAFFECDEDIKNTDVLVAGFPSLNRTLCEIFISLEKNARSLTYVLVGGTNDGVYTNETLNFAVSRPNAERIDVPSVYETDALLDVLFDPSKKGLTGKYSTKVRIYKAKNVAEETEYAARLIAKGVRDGSSFKDFAVCVGSDCGYELTLRRIFKDYGIPCFIDSAQNLAGHPLTKLICSYIDVVRRNYYPSDVLAFIKNPLFESDLSLADRFENYFLKKAINRRTVREPFALTGEDGEEKFEEMRKKAMGVLGLLSPSADFTQALGAVRKMLDLLDVKSGTERLSELLDAANQAELSAYNAQAYDKLCDVLTVSETLLADKKMPLAEVKNVILSGMTACKVSLIPKYEDSVFVGDYRAIKYNRYKYLFMLGLNEDVPAVKFDSALLCDRDIIEMENSDVLVEPKIKEVNRRERENACMATVAFSDGLYMSFSMRTADGDQKRKSEIIEYAEAAFSDEAHCIAIASAAKNQAAAEKAGGERADRYRTLGYMTERSAAFAFAREVSEYKEGLKNDFSVASAYYSVMKEIGNSALPDKILSSVNCETGYYTKGVNYVSDSLSATAVEGFFRCPYANFLQRGVKLARREERVMRSNTLGNLMHEVAAEFTGKALFDGNYSAAQKKAEEIFDSVAEKPEYARYKKDAGGKTAFSYIKREAVRFCMTVYEGCMHSSFRPIYSEESFGFGKLPAISLNTRVGKRRITGKVDRVDVYDGKMRIIDYKTSLGNKVDEEELYTGKKLQLFLYANAFSSKYKPVGAYYFPIEDGFGKEDDEFVMIMRGKTLADEDTARLIDDTITEENPKGKYVAVNVAKSKDNKFRYPTNLLSAEEFAAYLGYAEKVAAEGIAEINEGVIIASPQEGACEYCDFHGMCGYDEALDARTRTYDGVVDKEVVIAAASGEKPDDDKTKTQSAGSAKDGENL